MDKITVWVSYWLQDGTQTGATLEVDAKDPAHDIDRQLMAKHGMMYGDVADWGEWEDDEEDAEDLEFDDADLFEDMCGCDYSGLCTGPSCKYYFTNCQKVGG